MFESLSSQTIPDRICRSLNLPYAVWNISIAPIASISARIAGAILPLAYKETDLCIGVDRGSWQPEILVCAERFVRELRTDMDRWIGSHPDYAQALTPFQASGDAPGIFKEMSRVTQTSGIGPMSAVAGAVALKVGENLKKRFGIKEVIVENGGDIYADLCQDMDISVFAGSSPFLKRSVCISRQPMPPRDLYLFRNRRSVTQLR